MERVVSPEERIRRAEEIYYRRRNQGVRVSTASMNIGESNKVSLGRKMIIQILVCVCIYFTFFLVKGYKNVFSENVINETRAILNYDINFKKLYGECKEYFSNNFNNIIKKDEQGEAIPEENTNDNSQDLQQSPDDGNQEILQDENNGDKDNQQSLGEEISAEHPQTNGDGAGNTSEGIGGGSDVAQNSENDGTQKAKQDFENLSQMQQDADYISQNYNIIKPVEGRITSEFGSREETEIISAFHQGVDIGASTGTAIHAAMEGTVVASSYAGDYGNHIKVQNGEVLTVYAHCSELGVNVGDYVTQGQEIGKVGATGKVTGAHLHFEIRRDGRYVDPKMILSL